MRLKSLVLTQFKNYSHFRVEFPQPVNCFVGNNGTGKTNLLDAIYYLCIGKSYFNAIEQQNFQSGTTFLRLEGQVETEAGLSKVEVIAQRGAKKSIKKDGLTYERLADHIGWVPIVIIAPDDNVLILGASDVRRRFLDVSISQLDQAYLYALIRYNKLLSQRNSVLKSEHIDEALINTYDAQMIPLAEKIHEARREFVEAILPGLLQAHQAISGGDEVVSCTYISSLNEFSMSDQLLRCRERDMLLRRSTSGVHRDDLEFLIHDGKSLKKYGSQGQQKSFLLALKLAQLVHLKSFSQKDPILLLDDIFDKLDRYRMQQLFSYIFECHEGQIFMTDTNGDRLSKLLTHHCDAFELFELPVQQSVAFKA